MLLNIASAQQIQRNYRTLFNTVIDKKEPLVILNKNKPEVVIVEMGQFEDLQKKAQEYELEMAKKAILIYKKEEKKGKLKKLKSLADLM